MTLAIVIPCRNQIAFTRQCLESLFAGTVGDYRVILIDNESTDGTAEWVTEHCAAHGLHLDVICFAGVNLSACWNLGIRQAIADRCELVAVINNNVCVGRGWDLAFREHFAANRHTWCAVPECTGTTLEGFEAELMARTGRRDTGRSGVRLTLCTLLSFSAVVGPAIVQSVSLTPIRPDPSCLCPTRMKWEAARHRRV